MNLSGNQIQETYGALLNIGASGANGTLQAVTDGFGNVLPFEVSTTTINFTGAVTGGPIGPTGPAGSSGVSGTSGTSGTDGTSGTSGADGTSGTSGADGTSGTSGVNGATGPAGTSGTSGVNGATGPAGTSGTSGVNGTSGTSGADGTSGTSGVNGATGPAGTSGTSGVNGATGPAGTSGTSGVNGTSGTSGADGTSGTSGVNGATGATGIGLGLLAKNIGLTAGNFTYTTGPNRSVATIVFDAPFPSADYSVDLQYTPDTPPSYQEWNDLAGLFSHWEIINKTSSGFTLEVYSVNIPTTYPGFLGYVQAIALGETGVPTQGPAGPTGATGATGSQGPAGATGIGLGLLAKNIGITGGQWTWVPGGGGFPISGYSYYDWTFAQPFSSTDYSVDVQWGDSSITGGPLSVQYLWGDLSDSGVGQQMYLINKTPSGIRIGYNVDIPGSYPNTQFYAQAIALGETGVPTQGPAGPTGATGPAGATGAGFSSPYTGDIQIIGSLLTGDSTNSATGDFYAVLGGTDNDIESSNPDAYMLGGASNKIQATGQHGIGIIGGQGNVIFPGASGMFTGSNGSIIIGSNYSCIAGYTDSTAGPGAGVYSSLSAENNGSYSTIIGTGSNLFLSPSTIRCSADPAAAMEGAFIGGGYGNTIGGLGLFSGIIGGSNNLVQQQQSVIIGGCTNSICDSGTDFFSSSYNSAIIGGCNNIINQKNNSVIIGGQSITADAHDTVYVPNLVAAGQGASRIYDVGPIGGGTTDINWNSGNSQKLTLTGSVTLTFSNPIAGANYMIEITQGGVGSYTITWPTIKWMNATAPTLSTAVGKIDVVSLVYDGTNYLGTFALNFA